LRYFSSLASISVSISPIGLGGGVVTIAHPIHAPIADIRITARVTGMATRRNAVFVARDPRPGQI